MKFPFSKQYCIDTSALIDLQEYYPPEVFKTLWENMEQIVHSGELIAPQQVFEELNKFEDKDDKLL